MYFCQAEDGILDADVTGVQTCALPISEPEAREAMLDALLAAQVADREFREERVEHRLARFGLGLGDLEDGADVLLDRQPAKDRGFLRQVADAEAGAAGHPAVFGVLPPGVHPARCPRGPSGG